MLNGIDYPEAEARLLVYFDRWKHCIKVEEYNSEKPQLYTLLRAKVSKDCLKGKAEHQVLLSYG